MLAHAVCTDVISTISGYTVCTDVISTISSYTVCTDVVSAISGYTVCTHVVSTISGNMNRAGMNRAVFGESRKSESAAGQYRERYAKNQF